METVEIATLIISILVGLALLFGIPSAITSIIVNKFNRQLEAREVERKETEEKQHKMFLMMMKSSRANAVGLRAIATAVARIPDAKCNGDMKKALERMEELQAEEKDFLIEQGIERIFPSQEK